MDQALGKEYNFESKAAAGIIGVTRKKEAVNLSDLFKHDKKKCVKCFNSNVDIATNTYSALENLHHENKILTSMKQKSEEQIGEK